MKVVIDADKTKSVRGNRAKELLDHISELFTKEEIIAILTELKTKIEELDTPSNGDAYMTCSDIIQQEIDNLKEK